MVTITGANFSSVLAENEVTFNDKPAIVTAATATQLIVSVPRCAGTGAVAVTSKGQTALNQPTFTYEWLVSTVAGSGELGFGDGPAASAKFGAPAGIVIDDAGNLYVSDYGNQRIRKITASGVVSTFAGGSESALVNGVGASARFNAPGGMVIDANGNLCSRL